MKRWARRASAAVWVGEGFTVDEERVLSVLAEVLALATELMRWTDPSFLAIVQPTAEAGVKAMSWRGSCAMRVGLGASLRSFLEGRAPERMTTDDCILQ